MSSGKNTTSISSNDDDSEVANSFPTNDSTNKGSPFPILQVPSLFQLNVRKYYLFNFFLPLKLQMKTFVIFMINIKLYLKIVTTNNFLLD